MRAVAKLEVLKDDESRILQLCTAEHSISPMLAVRRAPIASGALFKRVTLSK
jgi:hypothetical protein